MSGERIPGETELSYQYFCLYRDQTQRPRSLRDLCEHGVNGKKRQLSVIARWSSQHRWQERVEAWDIEQSRKELAALVAKRQKDIESFVQEDFLVAKGFQRLASQYVALSLREVDRTKTLPDGSEARQWSMTYSEARRWLQDLIGFYEEKPNAEETDGDFFP